MSKAPTAQLLRAADLLLLGDWRAAHEIVQAFEADAVAGHLHALCHKAEGDLANARYWYARIRRAPSDAPPAEELAAVRAALLARTS
jgi:hypothetical protein